MLRLTYSPRASRVKSQDFEFSASGASGLIACLLLLCLKLGDSDTDLRIFSEPGRVILVVSSMKLIVSVATFNCFIIFISLCICSTVCLHVWCVHVCMFTCVGIKGQL